MSALPETYSVSEVCTAFGITPEALSKLVREGKVGYFIGRRARRFTSENIAQIRAAIEIKPQAATDDLSLIGVTRRGVARRRARRRAAS